MSRNPIEELQDKIKAAFKVYASVALGRINRHFELAGVEVENRVKNTNGECEVGDFQCVRFYGVANDSELPATLLIPEQIAQRIKFEQSELFGDLVLYIDKVRQDLTDNIGIKHSKPYDLQYGVDKPKSDLGLGVNLPISNATAMKLYALAARLLAAYPLDRIEKQINGEVSLQLPDRIIENALLVKKAEAKSDKPNHVERRERYPDEFDITKINELLDKVREKIAMDQKTEVREIS